MIAAFHRLVSEILPNWLFATGQDPLVMKTQRIVPARYSEAEAAAWLMSRERRHR